MATKMLLFASCTSSSAWSRAPAIITQDHVEAGSYISFLSRLNLLANLSLAVVLISFGYVLYQSRVHGWRWWRQQVLGLFVGAVLATLAVKVRYNFSWHLAIHGAPFPDAFDLLQSDGTWLFYTDPIYSLNGVLNGIVGLGAPYIVLALMIRRGNHESTRRQ